MFNFNKKINISHVIVDGAITIGSLVIDTGWNKKYGVGVVEGIDTTIQMYHISFFTLRTHVIASIEDCRLIKFKLENKNINLANFHFDIDFLDEHRNHQKRPIR